METYIRGRTDGRKCVDDPWVSNGILRSDRRGHDANSRGLRINTIFAKEVRKMDFRDVSHVSHSHEDAYSHTPANWSAGTTNLILNALPAEMHRVLQPSLKPVVFTKEQF